MTVKLKGGPKASVSGGSLVIAGPEEAMLAVSVNDWVTGPPMPLPAEIVSG